MTFAPSGIIIDPGHGWSGDRYDSGFMIGRLDEVSIVDGYVADLVENLLLHSIPYEVLPTRVRPGLEPEQRAARAAPKTLTLSCHLGWAKAPAHNGGHLYVKKSRPQELPLAVMLADVLEKWGRTTCKAYAGVKIVETRGEHLPDFDEEQHIMGIHLEPFCLNAVDSVVYASRLRMLGHALAEALVAWICSVSPGLKRTKTVLWQSEGKDIF